MKKLLCVFAFFLIVASQAQSGLYRHFTQTPPQVGMGWMGNPQTPVPTSDGGYLLKNWLLYWGFESPGGLGGGYTIKTDANFVPQWKKNYSTAIPLPTGGIILINGNVIEKVTASGTQVWIKYLSTPIFLNDAVVVGNKIRFVGNLVSYTYAMMACYTSDGFSLLTDTSGNYISHALFQSSVVNSLAPGNYTYRGSAEFSKIKRDGQGNFFVYSNARNMSGIGSNMSIAKFDTSFNFVWGKTWGNPNHTTFINDIDILPNGRIIASAITTGNTNIYWSSRAALLKLNAQGTILAQCFFENRVAGSGLAKKANGNYVLSIRSNDSLFMLETDTSLNVAWHKFVGKGSEIGGSVIKNNNQLFTPLQYGSDLVLISNSIIGNSCGSYSMSFTKPTTTITLVNFTLAPTNYTTSIITGSSNSISSQSYVDSCKCPVFIPIMQNNLCVGNTGTITIVGTGNLSWYNTATGNGFLQSGPQFTFSSNSPTTLTVYAQDSACTANPIRTAVGITVHAVPTLSFSPANPAICYGNQVFVSVMGATNYTWSNNLPSSYVQNLNPLSTTVYTVTGSVAQGCTDTKTVAVTVVPVPTIIASSSGTLCIGQTATISASGGTTYNWSNGQTSPTFTLTPTLPGNYSYNVAGSNGVCNGYATATISAVAIPSVTIVSNPSIVCVGRTATIAASGANTYLWNNGASGSNLLVSPSSNTSYVVTGSNGGCQSTATITIPVQTPPVVVASASPSILCVGAPVNFAASGANTYSWSNGSSSSSFSLNAQPGLSTYSVTGSNGTCTAISQITVQGVPIPTITASSNPTLVCVGSTATITAAGASSYTWSNGSTGSTFTMSPLTTGQFSFNVLGVTSACAANGQVTLNSLPLPTISIASTSSSLCAGNSATINASGATTYSWSNGWVGSSFIATPSTSATYVIYGTNNNCSSSASISIPVQALPNVSIISTASQVCIGAAVILTASGANTYSWSNGVTTTSLSFIVAAGYSSYSLIGSVGNCSASATATILGSPVPTISIASSPTTLCEGASALITASGANSYTWSNSATTSSIQLTPLTTINMSVYGANGSCASLHVFSLAVSPSPTINILSDKLALCSGESLNLQASGANSYTWSTGAATSSLVLFPTSTTTYTVQGSNQFGCLTTAYYTQVVNLCLALDKQAGQPPIIQIYPNPNNGNFVINTSSLDDNYSAQLFTIDGKIILSLPLLQEITKVDINHLAKGIYILKIIGSDYVTKIIRN